MKSIKLSECTKTGQILLYDGETVGLQYVLRKIYNGITLPEIRLCSKQEQVDRAIEASLVALSNDVQNGAEKESYSLGTLDTLLVEIDVEKKDIRQADEGGYSFKIVS